MIEYPGLPLIFPNCSEEYELSSGEVAVPLSHRYGNALLLSDLGLLTPVLEKDANGFDIVPDKLRGVKDFIDTETGEEYYRYAPPDSKKYFKTTLRLPNFCFFKFERINIKKNGKEPNFVLLKVTELRDGKDAPDHHKAFLRKTIKVLVDDENTVLTLRPNGLGTNMGTYTTSGTATTSSNTFWPTNFGFRKMW